MEKEQQKNEALIHAININEKDEAKRILTDQERAFVNLCAQILVQKTLRDINEIKIIK